VQNLLNAIALDDDEVEILLDPVREMCLEIEDISCEEFRMDDKWIMNKIVEGFMAIYSLETILDYEYSQRKHLQCLNWSKITLNSWQILQTFGLYNSNTS